MKGFFPLILAILFASSISFSQSRSIKECNKPEPEVLVDLNSITKCNIEEARDSKTGKKQTELKISYRKVRNRNSTHLKLKKVVKKNQAHSLCPTKMAQSLDDSFNNTNLSSEKLKNLNIKEVLFSVADKIPLFKECISSSSSEDRKCFSKQMSNHFAKNFYPERASEDGIRGRVFIQFVIDFQGKIRNIKVKAQKKSTLLENEIKRVISKLTPFTPGRHNGLPINTKYSLPINLTLD